MAPAEDLRALQPWLEAQPFFLLGSVNAAGDCGVGIECARTAVRCALRNVAINLPGVEDAELAAGFAAKKEELEKRSALCYDTALGILKEKLQ